MPSASCPPLPAASASTPCLQPSSADPKGEWAKSGRSAPQITSPPSVGRPLPVYTACPHYPMFEWYEAKRLRVLQERSLDFRDATRICDGRPAIHAPSRRNDESRFVSTA